MISKSAIEGWVNRHLKDSRRAKRFSDGALDRKLGKLDPPPHFERPLWKHQKVTFLLCVLYPWYLIFFDPGLGKSKLMLDLIRWRIDRGEIERALVLVPMGVNVDEWLDIAAVDQPSLKVAGAQGDTAEKWAIIEDQSIEVLVMTYQYWLQLVCDHKAEIEDDPDLRGWMLDKKEAQWWGKNYPFVVLDETTDFCRNVKSLVYRALRQLTNFCQYRYGLTGTPFGHRPSDLWPQFWMIDRGETLGPTFAFFRSVFCNSVKWQIPGSKKKIWKHTFSKRMTDTLHEIIPHRSIRYRDDECHDMPKLLGGLKGEGGFRVRKVVLDRATWAWYEKLREEMRKARGNYEEVKSAFYRMRQVTSGYVGLGSETGDRIEIEFPKSPKLDALYELLHEIPEDRKVVVVAHLRATATYLHRHLRKKKFSAEKLIGGLAPTKRRALLDRFKKGKSRVLVMNQAGAKGMNLQMARYMIFYESPTDPIMRVQFEKRIHRGDSKNRCFLYELVVKGSLDEKILKSLEAGQDLFDEIVDR